MNTDDMKDRVAELERALIEHTNPASFVTLTCWSRKWTVTFYVGGAYSGSHDGDTAAEALSLAAASLPQRPTEQELAAMLGVAA